LLIVAAEGLKDAWLTIPVTPAQPMHCASIIPLHPLSVRADAAQFTGAPVANACCPFMPVGKACEGHDVHMPLQGRERGANHPPEVSTRDRVFINMTLTPACGSRGKDRVHGAGPSTASSRKRTW